MIYIRLLLLLYSNSRNDVFPAAQQYGTMAALRDTARPYSIYKVNIMHPYKLVLKKNK